MTRPQHALLALALAVPAAFGVGLAASGVMQLANGRPGLALALLACAAPCVALSFVGLRRVNTRD